MNKPTTIATWNVNSIAARLPLVLRFLEASKPDVICLQEIKCVADKFPFDELEQAGYFAEVNGQQTYNGVAILARTKVTSVRRGFDDDEPGAHARVISAVAHGIRIVNVYVPNGQALGTDKYAFKLDWLGRLRRHFDADFRTTEPVLLCGDFNVAPETRDIHAPERWEGHIHASEPERAAIENVRAWGFADAFRLHNEGGGFYSWWDYRAGAFRRNDGLRIDHIWVSSPLAQRCTGSWIDKETRAWDRPSDHVPVTAAFVDSAP